MVGTRSGIHDHVVPGVRAEVGVVRTDDHDRGGPGQRLEAQRLGHRAGQSRGLAGPGRTDRQQRGPEQHRVEREVRAPVGGRVLRNVLGGADPDLPQQQVVPGRAARQVPRTGGVAAGGGTVVADRVQQCGQPLGLVAHIVQRPVEPLVVDVVDPALRGLLVQQLQVLGMGQRPEGLPGVLRLRRMAEALDRDRHPSLGRPGQPPGQHPRGRQPVAPPDQRPPAHPAEELGQQRDLDQVHQPVGEHQAEPAADVGPQQYVDLRPDQTAEVVEDLPGHHQVQQRPEQQLPGRDAGRLVRGLPRRPGGRAQAEDPGRPGVPGRREPSHQVEPLLQARWLHRRQRRGRSRGGCGRTPAPAAPARRGGH